MARRREYKRDRKGRFARTASGQKNAAKRAAITFNRGKRRGLLDIYLDRRAKKKRGGRRRRR